MILFRLKKNNKENEKILNLEQKINIYEKVKDYFEGNLDDFLNLPKEEFEIYFLACDLYDNYKNKLEEGYKYTSLCSRDGKLNMSELINKIRNSAVSLEIIKTYYKNMTLKKYILLGDAEGTALVVKCSLLKIEDEKVNCLARRLRDYHLEELKEMYLFTEVFDYGKGTFNMNACINEINKASEHYRIVRKFYRGMSLEDYILLGPVIRKELYEKSLVQNGNSNSFFMTDSNKDNLCKRLLGKNN